jgi:hypothetical protein
MIKNNAEFNSIRAYLNSQKKNIYLVVFFLLDQTECFSRAQGTIEPEKKSRLNKANPICWS